MLVLGIIRRRLSCLLLEDPLEVAAVSKTAMLGDGFIAPVGMFHNDALGFFDAQAGNPFVIFHFLRRNLLYGG